MGPDLVRIAFPLSADESSGITRERLWAKALANGTFVLDNSPFHAYGVSYEDAVYAVLEGGDLVFSGVARRGGHSTYRIKLPRGEGHGYFLEVWPRFERLGCTYEGTGDEERLYAIDIPPGVPVRAVYDIFVHLERNGILQFEEGHYFDSEA